MSDVVWTAVVTGATGISTGALGYLGARQQTRVELTKLEQEREDPNTARNLGFRQALYLRYLDTSDAFRSYPTPSCTTRHELVDVANRFRRADDEMELFAAANVLSSRQGLWSVASKLLKATNDITDGPDDVAEFEELVRSTIPGRLHRRGGRLGQGT